MLWGPHLIEGRGDSGQRVLNAASARDVTWAPPTRPAVAAPPPPPWRSVSTAADSQTGNSHSAALPAPPPGASAGETPAAADGGDLNAAWRRMPPETSSGRSARVGAATAAGASKTCLAVGETVILLQPPLPVVGVSTGMERGVSAK